MSTLKSTIKDFGGTAFSYGRDAVDRFINWAKGESSQLLAELGSLIPGSVVGINANKVPEMTNAIENAVAQINAHLAEVHTETDPAQAFADPGMQAACRAYISGVMDACQAYVTQLLKLADTLDEIKATYEENQAKQSENLQAAGKEAQESVEKYTRGTAASN